jgi:DNA helicase-2/ATP-dependent DNA helicase PcrA
MQAYLSGLNEQQLKAATYAGKALLVLAGAGSGKTKTLIARAAHALKAGAPPQSLVIVTFTNKAARELKERLKRHVDNISDMYVGTFHSISHLFLRRYGHWIGCPRGFQIITPSDQKRMFREIFVQLNQKEQGAFQHKNGLSMLYQHYRYPTMALPLGWQNIIDCYKQRCEQEHLIDFDALIIKATQLYQRPEFQEYVTSSLQHIFVDEFQDTSPAQFEWVELLLAKNADCTLVGDDDQSIYAFRGADLSIIQQADLRLTGLQTIKLEQNYRSTPAILNLANTVIEQNKYRLGKTLWTANHDAQKPTVVVCRDEYDEADQVGKMIHQLLHQGAQYNEIAVLYRSNALSRLIEAQARKYHWPYKVSGGLPFFDREEIRDIMAYLQLIVDPHHQGAWLRVINKPARKIGNKTQEKIQEYAITYECSLWEASLRLLPSMNGHTAAALRGFIELIDELRTLAQKIRLQDLTTIVLQNTQLLNAYEKTEQAESKADNLYQFQQALTDFLEREIALEIETPLDILGRFLSEYLLDDLSDQQADDNSLVMSTCHAAKGLEWPYVIIIGAEDQFFPHEQSSSDKEIEEERRLMYVAITRAKKQLFLTQARQRQRYQDLIFPSLSRFLEPIGSDLLIITRSASSGAGAVPINQKRPTVVQKPLRQLLMDHPLFGTGIVEWSSQEHNLLKVRFPKDGLKTLRYSLCEPFLRSE